MSQAPFTGTWPEGGAFPVIHGETHVKMRDAKRLLDEAHNAALEESARLVDELERRNPDCGARETAELIRDRARVSERVRK